MTLPVLFEFEAQPVRVIHEDGGEPWFYAVDVCQTLDLSDTNKALLGLDDDERREHEQYSGSGRKPILINESGLYSLILRSRKAEAKRFKKWVTAEVLPSIRKHGRYEDTDNRMATLVGQTIGTDGFHMLGSLIKGKVASLPQDVRRRATMKIWSQTHAAFGVRSAADIPAEQLDSARNFIAAYALEGEWLGREEKPEALFSLDFERSQDLSLLLHYTDWLMHRWNSEIRTGLKELNPELYGRTWEFFDEAQRAARRLDKGMPELTAYFQSRSGGKRPAEYAAAGLVA